MLMAVQSGSITRLYTSPSSCSDSVIADPLCAWAINVPRLAHEATVAPRGIAGAGSGAAAEEVAAVDGEDLAGEPGGEVAGEEDDQAGHVLGLAEAAERQAGGAGLDLGGGALGDAGEDGARGDGVYG